ncbi:translin-associated factor X-interacting protein 1-like [Ischnura elegans]|uniref:translin-associated factor X-interacting protein 1-like n=1 Tax=Ischnura elegans TaxID=197161 RepID=UPI001ED8819D|nr:translin-associated factor X-interacting protein 1-like [Ischnura elegans]
MDFLDIVHKAESALFGNLAKVREYPNDDVEMELLEVEQYTLDSKLEVIKEALYVFARGFTPSRPLLLKMHELYSSAVAVRNKRLEEYIELSRALLGIPHIRIDPITYFQRKSKEKWKQLNQEKMELVSTVDLMKAAIEQLQTKIIQLNYKLENDEAQIKIEYKARKSALLEVEKIKEEMKRQIKKRTDMSRKKQGNADLEKNQRNTLKDCSYLNRMDFSKRSKDPIFLEEEIDVCQEAYSELAHEMCHLKSMYSDTVPLKRFEALVELVRALKKKRSELKAIIEALKEEKQKLEEENEDLRQEKEDLLERIDELESGSSMLATHWRRCGEFIPGGIERWQRLTNRKSNVEKLEILAKELEIMSVASKYYEDNVLFLNDSFNNATFE